MFSLQVRLEAFEGQYGGLSEDIYARLIPFVRDGVFDIDAMPGTTMDELIRLTRTKLMPELWSGSLDGK